MCSRLGEKADEVHRIALEHLLVGDVDAVVVDAEIGPRADLPPLLPVHRTSRRLSPGDGLELLHFQRRAQDRRQVADVLGDEEVVLHEALDGDQAAAVVVAELRCEPRLHVERQHLFRPAADEVQEAADRPQEVFATAEGRDLLRRKMPAATVAAPTPWP